MSPTELFYVCLGLLSIVLIVWLNRQLLGARGGNVSLLEAVYYLTALAALVVGWYFNFRYMREYGADATWANWTKLLFVNPASASGGQDLLFANVVIYPLWTFFDGRRSGMRHNWLWFPVSAITSFAFAMALFLALKERQLRLNSAR